MPIFVARLMYFIKSPKIIRKLFPSHLVWEIPNKEGKIFLTFDDGPDPDVSHEVLKILDSYQIKASFFCVGDNVRKHPETYRLIMEKGHATGNHSFNHLNGWKTSNKDYFDNIVRCREYVDSRLFRPPYGRIRNSQARHLKDEYSIIMWSVLAGDFDRRFSREDCIKNVLSNTDSGSIIVFHDSRKTKQKLLYALPAVIEGLLKRELVFDVISQNIHDQA
ncbi:MAG: polysaccharide deacetylase family protein [Bacteroidota bacterium]|nr:polysaccharide deacetylase family protein [Bacteroidota bacterium]